jgi:hypothetical protein
MDTIITLLPITTIITSTGNNINSNRMELPMEEDISHHLQHLHRHHTITLNGRVGVIGIQAIIIILLRMLCSREVVRWVHKVEQVGVFQQQQRVVAVE